MRVPFSPQPIQHLLLLFLLLITIPIGVRSYLIVTLICISPIASEVEHLFIYLLTICRSFWEKYLFRSSVHVLIELFCMFGVELHRFFIYFEDYILVRTVDCKYLPPFSWWPFCFVLLVVTFAMNNLFSLI